MRSSFVQSRRNRDLVLRLSDQSAAQSTHIPSIPVRDTGEGAGVRVLDGSGRAVLCVALLEGERTRVGLFVARAAREDRGVYEARVVVRCVG